MKNIDLCAVREKLHGQKDDLRVAWKIGHQQGHGEWFPPEQRGMLMSWVDTMNKKYGSGTHWLETQGVSQLY